MTEKEKARQGMLTMRTTIQTKMIKKTGNMRKVISVMALLLMSTMGYADSLERFINKYKEKEGAVYMVFNKDWHFNDASEGMEVSMGAQRFVSGTLALMGVEEMVSLRLDSCTEAVRGRFSDRVYDAVPEDYALVSENSSRHVYMSNSDEEYAYMLIVNNERPSLALFYVTSAFARAIMNDEGTGIDMEKFERYMERIFRGLEESLQGTGERVRDGLERLEKRIRERADEWEREYGKSGTDMLDCQF